jgi:hypothetical protein
MNLPTEKELEDYIWNNLEAKDRPDIPLGGHYWKKRQVRINKSNIADMIFFDRGFSYYEPHIVTIAELKRDEINIDTFLQAMRYAHHVKKFFRKRKIEVIIKIVLIGRCNNLPYAIKYLSGLMGKNIFIRTFTYQHKNGHFFFKQDEEFSINRELYYC